MRIVLEVRSGNRWGHKMLLVRQQTVEVGRSQLADFVFDDPRMSSKHFVVRTDAEACYLEDLQSTNGTYVNGQRVHRAVLKDQDEISAGQTEFVLQVEGIDADVLIRKTDEMGAAAAMDLHATFCCQACRSGMKLYHGSTKALPASSLAACLSAAYRQVLIVDGIKLGHLTAGLNGAAEYLFDWLPAETRPFASPLLITDAATVEVGPLIDGAWGQDGLVALYCERDEELPLDQIRRAFGGLIRPSLARPQLTAADPTYARGAVSEIRAVLVEGESPDSWNLISPHELRDSLQGFGLVELAEAMAG